MKLLYRILAAPLVSVVFLVAVGASGERASSALTRQFETLRVDKLASAHALGDIQTRMASTNALLYRTLALIDSLDAKAVEDVRQRIKAETQSVATALGPLSDKLEAAVARDLRDVVPTIDKYGQSALQSLTLAESTPGAATAMAASAERSFVSLFAALQKASRAVNADSEAMSREVGVVAARATTLTISLTLVAVVAALALGWRQARNVVRRIDHAVAASEAIARGELDFDLRAEGDDEVARLQRSLQSTQQKLGASMSAIQDASRSIQTASSEVAAGSQDLSNRTEQAAGSLQQTAGSLSQLTHTVGQSASAARQANQLAESASALALRGGTVVGNAVATMDAIHASSKKIADIIGTIDGIAFQTNILALNAAVEAARAGEQGRGFAVVASEVRHLAQRSAEAAREIKALIGASVDKAEDGARHVAEAGHAMEDIVTAVRHVGEVIAQITLATGEQSAGIEGVNRSVGDLDHMTQQNAALVEQSAAASESLREQATRLAGVLDSFRFAARPAEGLRV